MSGYGNRYVPDCAARRGGMGSVTVCTDPNLDRKVAIKFLQANCNKRRIYDEVHALQHIRSKHVVEIYDLVIQQPGNQIGIVQEYLSGNDLTTFHTTAPSPESYLRVLYQLARGLEDIHAHGQIHRDVKPNNAKRDQENIVKIFDFGLSRPDSDAQTNGFVGTLGFAAPELFSPGPTSFSMAVDVYAFAATALFLACGRLPREFLETPPRAEAWANTRGFGTIPLQIPMPLVLLLQQSLATEPTRRPPMAAHRRTIEQHLVHGQHRALLVHNGQTHACHKGHPKVTLAKQGIGSITIDYDGLGFLASAVLGDVYVNNADAQIGMQIPACCVITIGAPKLKAQRSFITMDVSHPEVVL